LEPFCLGFFRFILRALFGLLHARRCYRVCSSFLRSTFTSCSARGEVGGFLSFLLFLLFLRYFPSHQRLFSLGCFSFMMLGYPREDSPELISSYTFLISFPLFLQVYILFCLPALNPPFIREGLSIPSSSSFTLLQGTS